MTTGDSFDLIAEEVSLFMIRAFKDLANFVIYTASGLSFGAQLRSFPGSRGKNISLVPS